MSKLTLNNLTSGFASTATLNANFDAIETAIENTLSRNGATPNQMNADLDMNSKSILNLAALDVASLSINGTQVSAGTLDATELPDQATHADKFLQTNGTLTSWQTVLQRESISVRDYGALGDGVTDDTDAIQDALDAISAVGGEVVFPAGDYYITSGLTTGTKKAVKLRGLAAMNQPVETSGARIVTDAAIDMLTAGSASASTPSGIHIENLAFIGDSTTLSGVKVLRQNFVKLKGVAVGGLSTGKGIIIDGTGDSNTLNVLDGCFIRNCLIGVEAIYAAVLTLTGQTYIKADTRPSGSIGINIISSESGMYFGTSIDLCEKAIVIDSASNLNSFFGVRTENNDIGVEVSGDYSLFSGCIFNGSGLSAKGVDIVSGATNTKVLDCEYVSSSSTNRVVDAGTLTVRRDRFVNYDLSGVPFGYGTSLTTGTSGADIVLANNKSLRWANAAGDSAKQVLNLDATNRAVLSSPRARTGDGQGLLLLQTANDAGTLSETLRLIASGATGSAVLLDLPDTSVATSATAGAQTLPANPTGFLRVKINGTIRKIPYYTN